MLKFVDKQVVFEEIPDRVTMALTISNCTGRCQGCHSSWLRLNNGTEITNEIIDSFYDLPLCNCFLFLGDGNDEESLFKYAIYIKERYNIEIALYTGKDNLSDKYYDIFDFVKIGSYKEEFGPLNKKTTNQRLFYHNVDITYKFWK